VTLITCGQLSFDKGTSTYLTKFMTRQALALALTWMTIGTTPLSSAGYQFHRHHRPETREQWERTELYFGSNKPDGTAVTTDDFMLFVNEQITPSFPDGLTILTGYGQFLDSRGAVEKERSMVLILFYPLTMTDADSKIEAIRAKYKSQFQQESVLRVNSLSSVSF
jgi:hypothetical protein